MIECVFELIILAFFQRFVHFHHQPVLEDASIVARIRAILCSNRSLLKLVARSTPNHYRSNAQEAYEICFAFICGSSKSTTVDKVHSD